MDLSALRNKANQATSIPPATPETSKIETPAVVKTEPEVEEKEEKLYQTYRSGLENQKIIMPSGRTLRITGHKYITANQEEIDFLDEEIRLGFPGLKKGEPVTETDLDPMTALRKKIAAEERDKIMKEIEAGTSDIQQVVPASTKDLSDLAGNSNSMDAPAS